MLTTLEGHLLGNEQQYNQGRPVLLRGEDGRAIIVQTPGTRLQPHRHGLQLEKVSIGALELAGCPGFVEVVPEAGHPGTFWRVRGYQNRAASDLATWTGGQGFEYLVAALNHAATCTLD